MSLLDDARQMPKDEPIIEGTGGYVAYAICHGDAVNGVHAPDCPWLSMPKIVAALERLEAMQAAVNRCGEILGSDEVVPTNETVLTGSGP